MGRSVPQYKYRGIAGQYMVTAICSIKAVIYFYLLLYFYYFLYYNKDYPNAFVLLKEEPGKIIVVSDFICLLNQVEQKLLLSSLGYTVFSSTY